MSNRWVISDTHFMHSRILSFTGADDNLIRPGFRDAEDMDELMIQRWNAVVKKGDTIWHLGDVYFTGDKTREISGILSRLNGNKHLLLGNHDNPRDTNLTKYFQKIQTYKKFKIKDQTILFSHIPVHPFELETYKATYCVHGHIHEKLINDERYRNVCVEKTAYTPICFDELV